MVTKKHTAQTKKSTSKKSVAARPKTATNKVDYYPNRMTVAVSVLAVVSLVLLCAMAMYGMSY